MRLFHKDNKTELFTPGFISVLHAFGRDLKQNSHIHCLISEGGIGTNLFGEVKLQFPPSVIKLSQKWSIKL